MEWISASASSSLDCGLALGGLLFNHRLLGIGAQTQMVVAPLFQFCRLAVTQGLVGNRHAIDEFNLAPSALVVEKGSGVRLDWYLTKKMLICKL